MFLHAPPGGRWAVSAPSTQEKWRAALWHELERQAQRVLRSRYEQLASRIERECESPIERLFLAPMLMTAPFHEADVLRLFGEPTSYDVIPDKIGYYIDVYKPRERFNPNIIFVVVFAQVSIGPYRPDFLMCIASRRSIEAGIRVEAAIECDGHDFHERTKEQAERDRSRDRWFLERKLPLFRFTGSEIYRNPEAPSMQVFRFLLDEHSDRVSKVIGSELEMAREEGASHD
jgi:very-short-patch-repair endonuclease